MFATAPAADILCRKSDKAVALATTSEVHPPEIPELITAQSAWHDEC